MVATAKALKEQRAQIAKEVRTLMDETDADKGTRKWDPSKDQVRYDELTGKIEAIDQQIKNAERMETLGLNEADRREAEQRFQGEQRRQQDNPDTDQRPLSQRDRLVALQGWATRSRLQHHRELLHRCDIDVTEGTLSLRIDRGFDTDGADFRPPRTVAEAREQSRIRHQMREERAAQAVGTAALGGNTVPDEMMREIDVALAAWGGMREAATIISTNSGADMPIPTSDDTDQSGEIIGENAAVNEQAVDFGQLILQAYKYSSKLIPISVELLQDSATNMPMFLGERIGERIGRITNFHFTQGTGTGQPKGITVAAVTSGITAATAGELDWTEVLALIHSVDPAYRRRGARFMLHDNTLLKMKQMKDSQNRPVWMPALIPGQPDTFDGYGYIVNNDMPFAAASRGLIFGDLSKYLIREVRTMELMRLNERFAEKHQVAFLGFARYDGDLVDAGAGPVKFLTLA